MTTMNPPAGAVPPRARPEARPAGGPRSLAPREHGAYGQIGLPLVAALSMGKPGASAIALTVATTAAFLAHEPALLLLGQRGTRALREDGARARRRLGALGAVAAVTGAAGMWLAPEVARWAAIVPLSLAAALAPLLVRGEEKTALGELLAGAALAGAAIPVALAAGVPVAAAGGAWAAWCLCFTASMFAVRAVIAHARAPQGALIRLAAPAGLAAAAAALASAGVLQPAAALGAAPMLAAAVALAARPPSPRSLKKVGWALVASSLCLAAALGLGAHL